jgi:aspartate aminotransferase
MPDAVRLSRNVAPLRRGPTPLAREIRSRLEAGEEILDLSGDAPEHDVPKGMVDAAARALQHGGGEDGSIALALRAAAARRWSLLSGGRPVNADHVGITRSAAAGCFAACFTLFESGDFVLLPTPAPPVGDTLIRLARATPVPVPGDIEWSLKISVDDLARVSDARTAGILLGSPVDPTGAVYTRSELKAVLEWAATRGVWVVADERQRDVHYGSGPAPSVLDLPDEVLERVVVVTELGAGDPAWRVGVTLAPGEVADRLARLLALTGGPVSRPVQAAVTAGLADERTVRDLDRLQETARQCRERAVQLFRDALPGVEYIEPLGGTFLFFRIDGATASPDGHSRRFCERLLEEHGVALVPGEWFGDDRWARLSFVVPERTLQQGVARIAEFMQTPQPER